MHVTIRRTPIGATVRVTALLGWAALGGAGAQAQSLNFDFDPGTGGSAPPATYGAAGIAGIWNALPAAHGTTTGGLVDIDGSPTGVTARQIGGLALAELPDPAITGDDSLLMDDYVVTFSASLETCIFLDGLEPGAYEVLVYARMPDPAVGSYTSVDQEPGQPHRTVGGSWSGGHQALVSYSRHIAIVDASGELNLHSGVVPGADPALGAALNGLQIQLALFADGFESGDSGSWSSALP